jgi:EmrB/QacA subfamily drug resistance transporter
MNSTWVLITLILSSGIAFLDGSIVNVALSSMDRDLQLGLSGQQWVVDGYALTLSSFLILGGALGDRLGRRRVLLWGLFAFGVSSLACGLAPNGTALVIARLVQGAAAALLVPASLAIIRALFEEPARGRAIGTWSAWTSIAGVLGPLLGGALVDSVGWRWVFLINPPLIVLACVLLLRFTPESRDERNQSRLDWTSALLAVLGLGGLSAGLIELPLLGFSSLLVLTGLVIGAVSLVLFVARQARIPNPMMPLELFRSPAFSRINLVTLGVYFSLGGAPFFLPIYAQNVMGLPATQAGALLLPIPILLFLLSSRVGALAAQRGPRAFIAGGAFSTALGLLALCLLTPTSSFWTALPGGALIGLGLSFLVAPLTSVVLASVPGERAGVGSAINNVAARVAGLLAVAGLGAVFAFGFNLSGVSAKASLERSEQLEVRQAQTSGLRAALIACAAMCTIGGAVALTLPAQNSNRGLEPSNDTM